MYNVKIAHVRLYTLSPKEEFLMSRSQNKHVVSHPEGWAVRAEGSSRVSRVFETQREAIAYGREVAINQGGELFVHGQNGQIRERNSYGNDPHPPKG
jgi:hypothetical protein